MLNTAMANNNIYTIEDLSVLSKDQSFHEFFNHALDIRPSKRDSIWKTMVHDMAISYLDKQMQTNEFTHKDYLLISSFSLWQSLKADRFFQIKKDRYGAAYLNKCFLKNKGPGFCNNLLLTFWAKSTKGPELALELAPLIKTYLGNKRDLWQFYKVVTRHSISKYHCKKPEVFFAIQKKLLKSINISKSNSSLRKQTLKLINKNCLKSMQAFLSSSLNDNNPQKRILSYKILESFKLISKAEEDLFLTQYILETPKIGPIFNKSFHLLKKLSQNYARRTKVINKLILIDPLPGKVFALDNKKNRKEIFKLLSKSIPEYLGHYAKTCVNYLEGKGDFPLGTKTVECGDFFKISTDSIAITQKIRIKYSAILKPIKKSISDKK